LVKWEVNKNYNNEDTIAIGIMKMLLLQRVRKYNFKKEKKFCLKGGCRYQCLSDILEGM